MNNPSYPSALELHHDPDLFRESVRYTAGQTGFLPRLIEKDYFCGILLYYLGESHPEQLVFKGGTCLAKVHLDFYRLSEDLDFIVPMPTDSRKAERSKRASPYKQTIQKLPAEFPFFSISQQLTGHNESKQYLAAVTIESLIDGRQSEIKMEIGFREPLLIPSMLGDARTLLLNAADSERHLPSIPFNCLSFQEAMSEKFRAALTRKEVAIRDFFDIDYAVQYKNLNTESTEFIDLVRKKIDIPGNDPPDISNVRLARLSDQMNARLKPVLRESDFNKFDLNRSIEIVKHLGTRLNNE